MIREGRCLLLQEGRDLGGGFDFIKAGLPGHGRLLLSPALRTRRDRARPPLASLRREAEQTIERGRHQARGLPPHHATASPGPPATAPLRSEIPSGVKRETVVSRLIGRAF